ncbi:Tat pathway signal protein [uncultured Sulfitobacter sp.]|uniref:Acg family FMN-binding oxidoreductase n=1 Tax=uncultured Sulfitobacter sp. TaxID=191468 RepID=UPI0026057324|nr:Tat pathway signal protein [uncultured Sulfitobacter sp.]
MVSRRTVITSGLSVAAIGAVGYATWPKLDGYNEEVARQRRLLSADPERHDLLRMATLAANGHNTQPWKFRLNDNTVTIQPDFSRRTEVVDPDNHHLFISLGCAAENLNIAAQARGWNATPATKSTDIEVMLESAAPLETDLYQAIPLRQSTRSQYDGQPVSASDIALLKAATEQGGVSVLLLTEPKAREDILEFVVEGNSAQMDDPAFVAELRDWIRFTPDEALRSGDGLFAACSGNPVAPGWIAERLFGQFFKNDTENDKYSSHIRSSAGIAIFIGDQEDPDHWIKVGQSFQRFALQATVLGIRTAHINQPIEVPRLRGEFARWMNMPDARPDLIVRFGRAPALPMSLRRPIESVIV